MLYYIIQLTTSRMSEYLMTRVKRVTSFILLWMSLL